MKRFYSKQVIGFIGLGNMGYPMASNISKNGYQLLISDMNIKVIEQFKHSHSQVEHAAKPCDIASYSDIVITMLPANEHVKQVYLNKDGLLSSTSKAKLMIDCSTISPKIAKDVHEKAKMLNIVTLDAPVSGGVPGATNGTLTFMIGNVKSNKENELVTPLLKSMGNNLVHCGSIGNGLVAKLCNNMLLAVTMTATSEALLIGKAHGLDPVLLSKIFNTSTGRSWSSDTYNPCPGVMPNVPSSRNYENGFSNQLMAKDLSLALDSAVEKKCRTLMGSNALQIYSHLSRHPKFKSKDFSSVYQYLEIDQ